MTTLPRALAPLLLLLAGCATTAPAPVSPADAFLAALASHCGHAYAGHVVTDEPASPDSPFAGKPIVLHVRTCAPWRIEMPLHVGDDHSRTWVVQRSAHGRMHLTHFHQPADGHRDPVGRYGGWADDGGTAQRQVFGVDPDSAALFGANGLEASRTNAWTLEIEPGQRLAYALTRPSGRHFRLEFDLTRPVPLPPPAWGYTGD